MSKEFKNEEIESMYYLAYTLDKEVFHYGELKQGQVITSGQQELETFEVEQDLSDRLGELTGDVDYYANKKKEMEEQQLKHEKPVFRGLN